MTRRFQYPGVHSEPIEQKPGIYQAVPFEQYLRWNAISNSSLSAAVRELSPLVVSMAHYYQQMPVDETPAMRFGTMAHAAKFEFMNAIENYDILPDFTLYKQLPDGTLTEDPCRNADGKTVSKSPKSTKDYEARVAAYKAGKVGKMFVDNEDFNRLAGLLQALDRHPLASEYFENNGPKTDRELSILWEDPVTGLRCKARLDCVQHHRRLVIDLKTGQNLGAFEKVIARYCYHRQAAWYCDGMQVLTSEPYTAAIVAAEAKGPTHGVMAAPVSFATLSAGRTLYRRLLTDISQCIESRQWPQYASPAEWQLPPWAMPHTTAVTDGVLTSW